MDKTTRLGNHQDEEYMDKNCHHNLSASEVRKTKVSKSKLLNSSPDIPTEVCLHYQAENNRTFSSGFISLHKCLSYYPDPTDLTAIAYDLTLLDEGHLYKLDVICHQTTTVRFVQALTQTHRTFFIANFDFGPENRSVCLYPEHDQTVGSGKILRF